MEPHCKASLSSLVSLHAFLFLSHSPPHYLTLSLSLSSYQCVSQNVHQSDMNCLCRCLSQSIISEFTAHCALVYVCVGGEGGTINCVQLVHAASILADLRSSLRLDEGDGGYLPQ